MGLLDEWIPMTACVWQVYGIQCMLSLTSYHLFQVKYVAAGLLNSACTDGTSADLKPVNQGSLTIHGLHLNVLFLRKMSFFTDKKEIQRSATALRYVAHVYLLVEHIYVGRKFTRKFTLVKSSVIVWNCFRL
ncbi:uncharacterized protein LOC109793720 isoform X2 [Cajanus cajan]|uniref:uncharacterized protein LOC109793720 isoform X2 n=1 Tax=Cajanus cajan TaxID=3821 RepID=UPI0010FAF4F7|nr:uncharacterized protein LOC109793720 isoform X2 [Cajanus cajan]